MKRKLKFKNFFALLLAASLLLGSLSAGNVYATEENNVVSQESSIDAVTPENENLTDTAENDIAPAQEPSALSVDEVPETIQFSTLRVRAFEMVDIQYIIDDAAKVSAQMPSGLIKDNVNQITDLTLPANVKLDKAYVLHTDGTTTDIARIGALNSNSYYSLVDDQDTGILLKADEEIVLQLKTVYQVKYIYDATYGTIVGKTEVFKGDDLLIQTKPVDYYHQNSAKYSIEGGKPMADMGLDGHGYSTVPAADIIGDVTIFVDFAKDAPYTFEMETDAILHGFLCAECSASEGENQTAINHSKFTFGPDGTAKAILYSQNWSGGDQWILNKLTINGEDVRIPFGYKGNNVGEGFTTIMKDGTKVIVKFDAFDVRDEHAGTNKNRNKYSVVVEGAKGDIKIAGNFKEYDPREIIVKDMTGIKQVASVYEKKWHKYVGSYIGDHYDYSVIEAESLVFETWNRYDLYNDPMSRPIYVYDVLPGYNPHTVKVDVYYDGVLARQFDENFPIGTDPNKIADQYQTDNYHHFDQFRVDVATKGYPYAFALKQMPHHNQMMHISASAYQYKVEYALGGGTFSDDALDKNKYTISSDKQTVTEKQAYSIEHGAMSTNMPMNVPARDGYVFAGWMLETEDVTVYSQNQQFIIDENSIQYAQGNNKVNDGMKFVFKAIWEDASTSDKVPYTISYYKESTEGTIEVDGKFYELMYEADKVGVKGSEVVVIDDHHPGDAYELNEAISKIKIDSLEYEVDDEIYFYYDLKSITHNLTIGKTVAGKYGDQTKEFTINLTVKDASGSLSNGGFFYDGDSVTGVEAPVDGKVTFVDGVAQITLKSGQSIILKEVPEEYQYTIVEADYSALGYTTTYEGNGATATGVEYVMGEGDEVINIVNTKDTTTEPETGVFDNIKTVAAGLSIVGLIALLAGLLLYNRRRISK